MNTYQPGQRVRVNASWVYDDDARYVGPSHIPNYDHRIRLSDGGDWFFEDHEVEPLETPSEPGMRTVLIKGVPHEVLESNFGEYVRLDNDETVTLRILEKLGFEVRS